MPDLDPAALIEMTAEVTAAYARKRSELAKSIGLGSLRKSG